MVSGNELSPRDIDKLKKIIEDLNYIFSLDEIEATNLDNLISSLKSNETRSYLKHLFTGSKPETALREAFFAGDSILSKYLFGSAVPEVRENGFVDYLIRDQFGHIIILELKSPFNVEKVEDKTGRIIVKKLKQRHLDWEKHKGQIKNYINQGEYVILTNLKEWVFFSRDLNPTDPKPFYETSLSEFIKDYEVIGNLKDYADRKAYQSIRYELDKKFLESLKEWVKKLSEVKFNVDDKRKLELIIATINKFIFIQTLDDYGVIEFKWIQKKWTLFEQDWISKGKLKVLEEFLNYVNRFFYQYYDTELFKENFLDFVAKEPTNIDKLYNNFKMVLGLTYLQTPIVFKGIMQYNFRLIDEDVLGKAYEIFLAEQRKEEGAYYTPKYITEYIVENTVGRLFDDLLKEIKTNLEQDNFDKTSELVKKFTSVKVLDPACGSGSFLIKALRKIKSKYDELKKILDKKSEELHRHYSSLGSFFSIQDKLKKIEAIKNIIGDNNDRKLISRIILRHIHGNDLDKRALEVAKVNIWLEAIKLSPSEFRFDRLPSNTEHILPDLQMNLGNGDSLIGLPEDLTVEILSKNHKDDIIRLFKLRQKYLEDPTNPEFVEEIERIKNELRKELDEEFKKYLKEKNLSLEIFGKTRPFHWALEFWHVFFNENGSSSIEKQHGFDVIIGNPPYINYRLIVKKFGVDYIRFLETNYEHARGQFDITIPFTEKAFKLLRKEGVLSYIMTNKFMVTEYGYDLRKYLLTRQALREIIDVSNIKVFKDANTYPVVFIAQRIDEDLEYNIRIGSPSEEEMITRSFSLSEIPKSIFVSKLPLYILTPYITDIRLKIFEKVQGCSTISNLFKCGVAQTGFSDKIKSLREVKEGDYIQFVQGEDITPFYIIPPDKYYPLSELSKEKIMEFKQRKIMIPGMVRDIYCGYDTIGVGCGRVYYITEDKSPYPLSYLVALFNSLLFKFVYRVAYGMSHLSGDYLRINSPYLRIFGIKEIDAKTANKIEDYVNLLVLLKKVRYKSFEIWKEWCARLKNNEYSLHKILSEDARLIRTGEFNKAWTSKATFYPTESMPNMIFNNFKVVGGVSKHVIKIYGLDEDNREKFVYEMEFSNRELMLHIYFSLLQTLESRAKIETLSHLFAKTMIPIIKEINKSPNELIPNIMKKITDEFRRWLNEEKIEVVETDIVKIDNEIEDIEAKIDAIIFRLYGLKEEDIKVVFDFLKTPMNYQRKVLDYFKTLEL
jgi:hypothetical protein